MADPGLQWINLQQFQGLYELAPITAPQGAATEMTNCYPAPGGGLHPSWKSNSAPSLPAGIGVPSGFFVDWPIVPTTPTTPVPDLWAVAGATPTSTTANIYRNEGVYPPGFIGPSWALYGTHTVAATLPPNRTRFAYFRTSTANTANPIILAINMHRNGLGYIHLAPDPASAATDSLLLMRSANVDAMFSGGQRLVWMETRTGSHTLDRNAADPLMLNYTDLYSTTVAAANYKPLPSPSIFGPTFMVPVDVSDVLIGRQDGAFLLQGGFEDASQRLVQIPNMPSSAHCQPAVTPWGVVYGQFAGPAYAWTGGSGAENIAPTLHGGFWQADAGNSQFVSFDYFDNWLFLPNGYIWDGRTKAWWKHSDWSTSLFHQSDRNISMISLHSDLTCKWFEPSDNTGTRVSAWQWTSGPLAPPSYRPFEVREVQLIVAAWSSSANDAPTWTVTVGSESHSVTTAADTTPDMVRLQFHSHVDTLKVRVQCSATTNAGLLKEIRVGVRGGTQIRVG